MPKISIIIAVYNHEKYIEQAINSVLEQKTEYELEVFIGEDCSTDKSRDVLMSLESKCPKYFHFIYRDKNLGSTKNFEDLFSRITGDYFIILEGDDYWTYPYKLQKQVNYLETHKEYILCSHNTIVVDEYSNNTDIVYPECKENEYTLYHFRQGLLPGQTATNLYRNYYKMESFDYSLENIPFTAGDRRRAFQCVTQGKVHCVQEKWSAYRYIRNGGSSFSANHKRTKEKTKIAVEYYYSMIEFSKKLGNKEAIVASEELYYLTLLSLIRQNRNIKDIISFLGFFTKCIKPRAVFRYVISKGKKVYYLDN